MRGFSGQLHDLREASRRLWVRLTLAFTLAVLIGILTTALVSAILTSEQANSDLINQTELDAEALTDFYNVTGGIVATLATAYSNAASETELQAIMDGFQAAHPQRENFSVTFSLISPASDVMYSTHPAELVGLSRLAYDEAHPIMTGDILHGYLRVVIADRVPNLDIAQYYSVEAIFTDTLSQLWWVMLACGLLAGVLSGSIMGRALAAPLSRLSSAAQAIGARDLSRRVKAQGSAEAVQLAHAFNQMAADLENAETLRRQLVADVAHELRTPLTVLQGNLRAMLDGVYTMSEPEVASLYDQTRVLSRLVNDLHELSQAEARQLPLDRQPIHVNAMVANIAATFETVAELNGVTLQTTLSPLNPTVHGDATRLSQVLNNLLNNALTHTPENGTIAISLSFADDTVCISVKDNGHGIAAEHLPHLFDRFYRADRARSRHTGGTGLGLAIAKAIVEAHDGQISVYSDGIGHGATFRVCLPANERMHSPSPRYASEGHLS